MDDDGLVIKLIPHEYLEKGTIEYSFSVDWCVTRIFFLDKLQNK